VTGAQEPERTMTDAEEKLDKLKRALESEGRKLDEIGKEADVIDRDLHPARQPIDHPDDGGII
jgi:hypothetical protein